MMDVTERDLEKMLDADIETQEIEARKTPYKKIQELLDIQQRIIGKMIILSSKLDDELEAVRQILNK